MLLGALGFYRRQWQTARGMLECHESILS
jgi:hypothetical protein